MKAKSLLLPLLLISNIGLLVTDLYLPSFPAIEAQLGASAHLVQITLTAYLIPFSVSQLLYGPLAERFGRKSVALFGLGMSLLGTCLAMLSPNITTLMWGRALQGLALGTGPALFRAIMRDTTSGNSLARLSSIIATSTGCMLAFAPALGGYIQSYLGWRYVFAFILLYTVGCIVIVLYRLPETLPKVNPDAARLKNMVQGYGLLLKSKVFMAYGVCGACNYAALTAYLVVSPFIFQQALGLTPVAYGWLNLSIAGGIAIGGVCNASLVKRLGRHRMLLIAILIMLGSSLALFALSYFPMRVLFILLPMFIFSFGDGMTFGNCNAGALHHFPHMAGYAAALFGMLQIFGSAIGTLIISFCSPHTQRPFSILLIIMALICLIAQHVGKKESLNIN